MATLAKVSIDGITMYLLHSASFHDCRVSRVKWPLLGSGKPTLPASTLHSEHSQSCFHVPTKALKSIEFVWFFVVTGFSGRETETQQPSGATLSLRSHCQMMMTLVFWATSCQHLSSAMVKHGKPSKKTSEDHTPCHPCPFPLPRSSCKVRLHETFEVAMFENVCSADK